MKSIYPLMPHGIAYTHFTWSPWWGCTPVSAGCANCYAAEQSNRFSGPEYAKGAPRRATKNWNLPRKWNRQADDNDRPRVFPSMMDWLDEEINPTWFRGFLALLASTPRLNWLLLTKRPELFRHRLIQTAKGLPMADAWLAGNPPENVWIGATVEHELTAWRIPALLEIPARLHWLSVEPMLGHIEFCGAKLEYLAPFKDTDPMMRRTPRIDWVICGGESGDKARPMHPAWAESLRDECTAAGTPFFFKQWGEFIPISNVGERGLESYPRHVFDDGQGMGTEVIRVGKKAAGCLLDGREWKEIPV